MWLTTIGRASGPFARVGRSRAVALGRATAARPGSVHTQPPLGGARLAPPGLSRAGGPGATSRHGSLRVFACHTKQTPRLNAGRATRRTARPGPPTVLYRGVRRRGSPRVQKSLARHSTSECQAVIPPSTLVVGLATPGSGGTGGEKMPIFHGTGGRRRFVKRAGTLAAERARPTARATSQGEDVLGVFASSPCWRFCPPIRASAVPPRPAGSDAPRAGERAVGATPCLVASYDGLRKRGKHSRGSH